MLFSSSELDVVEAAGSDAAGATAAALAVAEDDAADVVVFCLADFWLTVFFIFLAIGFPCTFSIASLVDSLEAIVPLFFLVAGDMMMAVLVVVVGLGMPK